MKFFILLLMVSCADLTRSGAAVHFIETEGEGVEVQDLAERVAAEHDCRFIGYVDADPALFPGTYSVHQNEIHAALRNRAAKIGANIVVANFYKKPAKGIGLVCPEEFLAAHADQ